MMQHEALSNLIHVYVEQKKVVLSNCIDAFSFGESKYHWEYAHVERHIPTEKYVADRNQNRRHNDYKPERGTETENDRRKETNFKITKPTTMNEMCRYGECVWYFGVLGRFLLLPLASFVTYLN